MTYKSKYLYWYKLVWMKQKTLLAKTKQMVCNSKKNPIDGQAVS